jgi:hypothetical protein
VFHGTLQRAKSLRPLAVFSAVPEEKRREGGSGDGHRTAVRRPDTLRERGSVLKVAVRPVTGRTRDLPVGAQPLLEEELVAQLRRFGIIGHTVRRIGGRLAEATDRERAKLVDLLRGPAIGLRTCGTQQCRQQYERGEDQESPGSHARASGNVGRQSARLKVTVSVPSLPAMASLSSHQPPMLKRTPSITYSPLPRAFVTRGWVGSPWPC